MNRYTVIARIGKRDALYTVLAADENAARDHVRRDVAEHIGPSTSLLFRSTTPAQ